MPGEGSDFHPASRWQRNLLGRAQYHALLCLVLSDQPIGAGWNSGTVEGAVGRLPEVGRGDASARRELDGPGSDDREAEIRRQAHLPLRGVEYAEPVEAHAVTLRRQNRSGARREVGQRQSQPNGIGAGDLRLIDSQGHTQPRWVGAIDAGDRREGEQGCGENTHGKSMTLYQAT